MTGDVRSAWWRAVGRTSGKCRTGPNLSGACRSGTHQVARRLRAARDLLVRHDDVVAEELLRDAARRFAGVRSREAPDGVRGAVRPRWSQSERYNSSQIYLDNSNSHVLNLRIGQDCRRALLIGKASFAL